MLSSTMLKMSAPRPTALIVVPDTSLREEFRKVSGGYDLIEGLQQALAARGYDVVVTSCLDEAKCLMRQRSFDRIFSDGTLLSEVSDGQQVASAGSRVEDRGDGMARVQFDQVVPWSAAVSLLDILAATAPDNPRRYS